MIYPHIPGSEAAGALARYKQVYAESAFSALNDMRKNSPTGGALGQVTENEEKLLAAASAAMDRSQNLQDFTKAADRYRAQLVQSKANIAAAYKTQYGEDLPAREAAPETKTIGDKTYHKQNGKWYAD